VPLAYLIAGSLFILALRGLSSPESSRRGNRLGMIGMAIAMITTLIHYAPHQTTDAGLQTTRGLDVFGLAEIAIAIAIGAVIGIVPRGGSR
jgi:NAD(P) transhydrogenase subunit beta